ncbi:YgaP family membrane protein [Kaarinaea lacus]
MVTIYYKLEGIVMKGIREKLGVVENLGWMDRTLRVMIGAGLISIPSYFLVTGQLMSPWYAFLMLFAVYPLITGIVGCDWIYNMFGVKSCGTSERNPCGSFPFEVDAALGRKPIPHSDIEHSLQNSHHEPPTNKAA